MNQSQRSFLQEQRVARFASVDAQGMPHVVPVCFALLLESVFITVDEKPKRSRSAPLKRVRNLSANPHVSLVVDRYDEDWSQLGWVMVRGRASVLHSGHRHERAQAGLMEKYPQLARMTISDLPVIDIEIQRTTSWGML